jgi:hypothetical protein
MLKAKSGPPRPKPRGATKKKTTLKIETKSILVSPDGKGGVVIVHYGPGCNRTG